MCNKNVLTTNTLGFTVVMGLYQMGTWEIYKTQIKSNINSQRNRIIVKNVPKKKYNKLFMYYKRKKE